MTEHKFQGGKIILDSGTEIVLTEEDWALIKDTMSHAPKDLWKTKMAFATDIEDFHFYSGVMINSERLFRKLDVN